MDGFAERKRNEHDHAIWLTYHGAIFQRIKKLPPLKDYLSGAKVESKGIDEKAIFTRLMAYQKRRQDVGTGR